MEKEQNKTEGAVEKDGSTCAGRHGNGSQGESLTGPPEDRETQARPSVVCIGTRAPVETCACLICDRRRVMFSLPLPKKDFEIEELPMQSNE